MNKPDLRPEDPLLRQFGFIGLFAFPLISVGVMWRFTDWQLNWAIYTLWSLGAICGALAPIAPRALIVIYVPMMLVAIPIGFVVSQVVMRAVYYLLFTPMALWFRLRGRDAMHRTLHPDAETYWTDHRDTTRPRLPSSYMRLY